MTKTVALDQRCFQGEEINISDNIIDQSPTSPILKLTSANDGNKLDGLIVSPR